MMAHIDILSAYPSSGFCSLNVLIYPELLPSLTIGMMINIPIGSNYPISVFPFKRIITMFYIFTQIELESVFIPPHHYIATKGAKITMIPLISIWVTIEPALHVGGYLQ